MSFAFFLSFIFSVLTVFLIYNTVIAISGGKYSKAFYCLLANFFLCGIGVFLVFENTNYIAQCFSGAIFGFVLSAIGGFIFKQFSPYTLKEWWQIIKSFAVFCYGKLKIYVPVALKFAREKSSEIYLWIKNRIKNRKR